MPTTLASRGRMAPKVSPTLTGVAGAFGPFVAAVVTAALFDGWAGIGALFAGFTVWRVGVQWYLFVLLWPPALSLVKTGLHVLAGGAAPDWAHPPFVKYYPLPPELASRRPFAFLPLVFLQQSLLGSSMGEEPGWRGYALPRLLAGYGMLGASAILGVLWAVWHLPRWLTLGEPGQNASPVWTVLGLVATTILFTWVYAHTASSLLLALLFHTSIAVTGLFLSSADAHPAVEPALSWLAAIAVIGAGW